jgi:hypothetical protein
MTHRRLSPSMTLDQFDNGYWYALELKTFARRLGIPSPIALRKDELERAIRAFLKSGAIASPPRRRMSTLTTRDVDRGLRLGLRIVWYVNNATTKQFLEREAQALDPSYRRRSGARYRLNRWREAQIAAGAAITYGDLVREYVRLSRLEEPYTRIPHGRYINFVSDFLASEPNATHEAAVKAWHSVKSMNVPKTYRDWARATGRNRRRRASHVE